jgi:Putative effector of murein hydrolase
MENRYILEVLFILLTLTAYMVGRYIYKKTKIVLLNTIIVSTVLVIIFLWIVKVDFNLYAENTRLLKYLLNLSVVSLGFLFYKYYDIIKSKGIAILLATFAGSLLSILSVWGIMYLMGADRISIVTMLPKSVTTPIAVVLSAENGGMVSVTAIMVIVGGILGAVAGPWFLNLIGIKSRVARGIAMGSASHAMGTAKALEIGAVEGAAGGVAIALMGLFTSFFIGVVM